jgi:hypothetical protein
VHHSEAIEALEDARRNYRLRKKAWKKAVAA